MSLQNDIVPLSDLYGFHFHIDKTFADLLYIGLQLQNFELRAF